MRRVVERFLLGLVFAGLPLFLFAMVIRPGRRRMDVLRHRVHAAREEAREVPPFMPVGQEERDFLESPMASWRTRMPRVDNDAARLGQMNRVVTEVNAVLAKRGVTIAGMRATWDPLTANFSLSAPLVPAATPLDPATDAPEDQVGGWVLEVEIAGPTRDLFKALAAIADLNPLLEPVGLRWEAAAKGPGHRQFLLLRNLYLKP